jgi:hypothetical protein
VHETVEARDAYVASDMEAGMTDTYDRLDEWLASQQAA